jgi:hypothetical protein
MLGPSQQPDEETLEWVRVQLGAFQVVSQFEHDHGYSKLWRIQASQDYFWLKMHAYDRKWSGEVHALTTWAPDLGLAPNAVAFSANPNRLILSEMPGANAEELNLAGAAEERLWNQAGEWLAKLHQKENDWLGEIAIDCSPLNTASRDPVGFAATNLERWVIEGRETGLLSNAEIDFINGFAAEHLPYLQGEVPRAVHRDYTPRNWLADSHGNLTAIIDFEHARWDNRAMDMNRPWDHEFLRNPSLIDAFFDGYGQPDERLTAQMQLMRYQQAVGGIVWGIKVGEVSYSHRNREALHRLMSA